MRIKEKLPKNKLNIDTELKFTGFLTLLIKAKN